MNREPAVAGQFYPGKIDTLSDMLNKFCPQNIEREVAPGIMVPHAGYVYSGAIAGQVYDRVEIPDQIILLGPNHHGDGHHGAVYPGGSWTTPLGDIQINESLAKTLVESSPSLEFDTTAHKREHSLEVQVPFIQYLNRQAQLVPICLGYQPLEYLLEISKSIAEVVKNSSDSILIIASTDMTHFESADSALIKDRLALDCVETLDAEGLFRIVVEERISMCGFIPTVVLLKVASLLGALQSEIVVYGNSGDVTQNYSDVVAYAGAIIGSG